ncbi:hypothetical protein [Hyphomicrobium sp.]|uniref:hypothetical protein n=1 Tax=Hyphomicrobium sp. TaxID=82 RepID=UPI002E2ECE2A|nr:hypothetical protein [Hyphomicrobium sp.]HEX2842102.1 hypothetical protein [Hyphomicrobium sp.]
MKRVSFLLVLSCLAITGCNETNSDRYSYYPLTMDEGTIVRGCDGYSLGTVRMDNANGTSAMCIAANEGCNDTREPGCGERRFVGSSDIKRRRAGLLCCANIGYNVCRRTSTKWRLVSALGMIADVPPFYVRFLKSVFSGESSGKHQLDQRDAVAKEATPGRLLPVVEPKRLQESTTALLALPAPQSLEPDALSLPNRDHLRRVVADADHVQEDAREGVDEIYDDVLEEGYQNAWQEHPRRRMGLLTPGGRSR